MAGNGLGVGGEPPDERDEEPRGGGSGRAARSAEHAARLARQPDKGNRQAAAKDGPASGREAAPDGRGRQPGRDAAAKNPGFPAAPSQRAAGPDLAAGGQLGARAADAAPGAGAHARGAKQAASAGRGTKQAADAGQNAARVAKAGKTAGDVAKAANAASAAAGNPLGAAQVAQLAGEAAAEAGKASGALLRGDTDALKRDHPWLLALIVPPLVVGLICVVVVIGLASRAAASRSQSCAPSAGPSALGGGEWVTASTFGGPSDRSVHDDSGAYGHLNGKDARDGRLGAFAELSTNYTAPKPQLDFRALGGLAPHTQVDITYNGRTVRVEKLDVGRGGPGLVSGGQTYPRAIDLWYETANTLGFSGLGLVYVRPVDAQSQPLADTSTPCLSPVSTGTGDCRGQHYTGPTVPGTKAVIDTWDSDDRNGSAIPPAAAPEVVKCMIAAANRIHTTTYGQWAPHGIPYTKLLDHYDCSSSTSYVMYWGGFIKNPNESLVARDYTHWGEPREGQWVTIHAYDGPYDSELEHVYTVIAGLRFDTGGLGYPGRAGPPGSGPRWSSTMRNDSLSFAIRHPPGL